MARSPTSMPAVPPRAGGRVLVLGGTAEGRSLAEALHRNGIDVVSTLAGRVAEPRLPVGEVRIGGFGGVDGLIAHLREGGYTHVVDATHPFAARMSEHAAAAAARAGIPIMRLSRPGWSQDPRASTWHWVDSLDDARDRADALGARPFLTTGRQTLGHFRDWWGRPVLVRVVEPVEEPPPAWTVVLDRGPYAVAGELTLMRSHRIDVLLTKDSGGAYTSAKLDAAQELGVPVVILRRPGGGGGIPRAPSVAGILDWLGLPGG